MKSIIVITAVALAACSAVSHAQSVAAAAQTVPTPQEQSAPVSASNGLSDLDAMTFGCPKAALNAAAREAAKVPSQGTYQFAYFRINNDSDHASYEVHFKSNYQGEADLKYCVAIYCQQGWDPKTTKISVRLMSNERQPRGVAAHGADCGNKQAPVKRRLQR
jgi:replicative DNA helicase